MNSDGTDADTTSHTDLADTPLAARREPYEPSGDRIFWEDEADRKPTGERPKVSVVIPSYGCEEYIAEAIDSVLAQKIDGVEIIVVDDCSTDDSNTIIARYAEQYENVFLVKNRENKGLYRSREVGSHFASGEYIGHLDADDSLDPACYDQVFANIGGRRADIIQFGMVLSFPGDESADEPYISSHLNRSSLSGEEALNLLLRRQVNFSLCNKLFHRDIWFDALPDCPETDEKLEDFARLPHLMVRARSYVLVSKAFHKYRQTPGSESRAVGHERAFAHARSAARIVKSIGELIDRNTHLHYLRPAYCSMASSIFKQIIVKPFTAEFLAQNRERFGEELEYIESTVGWAPIAANLSSAGAIGEFVDKRKHEEAVDRQGSMTLAVRYSPETGSDALAESIDSFLSLFEVEARVAILVEPGQADDVREIVRSRLSQHRERIDVADRTAFGLDDLNTGYVMVTGYAPLFKHRFAFAWASAVSDFVSLPDIIELGYWVAKDERKLPFHAAALTLHGSHEILDGYFGGTIGKSAANKFLRVETLKENAAAAFFKETPLADIDLLSVIPASRYLERIEGVSFEIPEPVDAALFEFSVSDSQAGSMEMLVNRLSTLICAAELFGIVDDDRTKAELQNEHMRQLKIAFGQYQGSASAVAALYNQLVRDLGVEWSLSIIAELAAGTTANPRMPDPRRRQIQEHVGDLNSSVVEVNQRLQAHIQESRQKTAELNQRLGAVMARAAKLEQQATQTEKPPTEKSSKNWIERIVKSGKS
ncbi:MAG: glycosyltransferase [Sphingomonadaceae bacterium]|nr:glycosyltransferase [Sphingomonadaceae bacterium]